MRPVRAIRRFVSLAAIAAVALSFSIGSASGAASSIQEAAQQADTVFVGIADPAHGAKTSFEVLVAYKGTPGLVIDHGCLKPFVAGKTYTVFASERNGVLQSDCAFTQEGVVPPTKILTAGRGGKAAGASPKPSAPESSSGSSFFAGPVFWVLFLIAAALAIPVYLLFRTRMRRRRT
ncbi:MAG: hypothetical protein ACJ76P_01770 [Actinomycetota bacterium]